MSNLLTDSEGRAVVNQTAIYLIQRRMSRFFKRNFVIAFDDYETNGGSFSLSTLLGQLNSAHDNELRELYRLLALSGGLAESVQDETFYVSDGGDDLTGNGTQAAPFSSLDFVNFLPRKINHIFRVLITGNIGSVSDDLILDFSFGTGGSLAFIGAQGEAYVSPGVNPNTVNEFFAGTSTLKVFGVTGPYAIDQFHGYFLKLNVGNQAGNAYPVLYNSDVKVYFRGSSTNVGASNFSMIEPVPSVTLRSLTIVSNGSRMGINGEPEDYARICFLNMKLNVGNSGSPQSSAILIDSSVPVFSSFVVLTLNSGNPGADIRSDWGAYKPVDTGALALTNTTILNLTTPFYLSGIPSVGTIVKNTAPPNESVQLITINGKAKLRDIMCRGLIQALAETEIIRCEFGAFRVTNTAATVTMALKGQSGGTGCLEQQNSDLYIKEIGVIGNTQAVVSSNGICRLFFDGGGRDPADSTGIQYGLYNDGIITVYLNNNPTNFNGTVGDWRDDVPIPAVTIAWPALESTANNGLGSLALRH